MTYLTKEELKLLNRIRSKVLRIIEKEFEKAGIDQAYYEFTLKVDLLESATFRKLGEIILIDDHARFCAFCGRKTYYYDYNLHAPICAECYSKINKTAQEVR